MRLDADSGTATVEDELDVAREVARGLEGFLALLREERLPHAVHLVADAAQRKMESALVLSADSDLAPAVRMAKNVNPSLFIAAVSPPKRFSSELMSLLPRSFHLGLSKLGANQLPDEVVSSSGAVFSRPAKWR